MSGIFETVMLVCFGFSWPMSLVKNYKCRTAKGMSLPFILLLIVGYLAGISAKFLDGVDGGDAFVLVMYFLNLAMVGANLFVYCRNLAFDRKAQLTDGRQASGDMVVKMLAVGNERGRGAKSAVLKGAAAK